MSRIGTMGPRKTKFNPATNNPFQGATGMNFVGPNGRPLITLTNPRDFQSPQVKNSALPFVIVRTKPPNAGATYGDNSRLEMGIARAQTLTPRIGFTIKIGVNNNGPLAPEDGIQLITITATDDRGNPVPAFGSPESGEGGVGPIASGQFTKQQASEIFEIDLRDGDNFNFSLQQAAVAENPSEPERAFGTFYFPEDILSQLRNPGDLATMILTINIDYISQTTGAVVSLTGAMLGMNLWFTED